MGRTTRWAALGAVWLSAAAAQAESTRFYELEGFGHFLDGNPESTAVTEDGAIAVGPEVVERLSDAAATFGAAAPAGDDVLVARLDAPQVLAVDKAGKTRVVYEAPQGPVTALLPLADGLLVAAGSPAKIYRVDAKGNGKLWHSPDAAFVWNLVAGADGVTYAATGQPGSVVRLDASGNGKVIFKPEQAHLRAMAYDARLGLFVGGGERGVLYRAAKEGDFRALYDTGHPEVTAVLVKDGNAFVAGVTGAAALAEDADKRGKGPEVRSGVLRVSMDGAAETLAGSTDEAVFAMAIDATGNVLVATGATGREDPRGRLYSIDANRRVISLIYQSPSRRLTHLLNLKNGAVAAIGGSGGRVTQLSGTLAKKGEFLTQPFDAGVNATFGLVQALGVYPRGTQAGIAVRTGQTAQPDATWSDWSSSVPAPGGKAVQVQNGRYMQARLTLESSGSASPLVQRLRVAYLRQNLPPFVREVSALAKGLTLTGVPHEESKSKIISLGDKSDDGRTDVRAAVRARQSPERGALSIKWLADDPNGDELRFTLSVRPVTDATWRLVASDLREPFYSFSAAQLPDGYYIFRVHATDAPSNPAGTERSDARESRAILVDNTPPHFETPSVSVKGTTATVRSRVSDTVGPLLELGVSLDGADLRPAAPQDGVLDGPSETLELTFEALRPGRHTVTLRAVDEADNEGFAEATFEVR